MAKILFVIDDSSEQRSLQDTLEPDHHLDFCYDPADAIDHVELTRPEIVILSYRDDGVSPLAIAHILRQDIRHPYMGVVYVAQTESNEWLSRLLNAGVDICLPGTRTMLQLKAAIESVQNLATAQWAVRKMNEKLHSAYQRLQNQSFTDAVTGLGNRQFLQNQLRLEFKRAQRYQKNLVLLLLQLDELNIAETPTAMEESLLTRVSETIGNTIRFEIDSAGRCEGGEFYVILPETDIDGAIAVAERLRAQIARLHRNKDGKHLACSVGVAHFNGDRGNFDTMEDFFLTAQSAKDTAIAHGGDQYWALDTPTESVSTHQSA